MSNNVSYILDCDGNIFKGEPGQMHREIIWEHFSKQLSSLDIDREDVYSSDLKFARDDKDTIFDKWKIDNGLAKLLDIDDKIGVITAADQELSKRQTLVLKLFGRRIRKSVVHLRHNDSIDGRIIYQLPN